jgi:hypothetical protein
LLKRALVDRLPAAIARRHHQRTIWALLAFEAWRVAYFGEVAVR